MDIGGPIIEYAFGALAVGAAVAFALAFGLGGRDAAARALADFRTNPPALPNPPAAITANLVARAAAKRAPIKRPATKPVVRKAPAKRK